MTAGEGNDSLSSGAGNDVMTGGEGNDVFVFVRGADRITDFGRADDDDQIDLSGVAGVNGMGDLRMRQDGDDLLLSFATGTLRLVDVSRSALDAEDFVF
jgi:Ca2+-binding RTX toxin-like protein